MAIPGFSAERALQVAGGRYAGHWAGSRPGAVLTAADGDAPGVHCNYSSPYCVGHTWTVDCDRYGSGGVIIQHFTKAVGSCRSAPGGGGSPGGGSAGGVDGGSPGGIPDGGTHLTSGGITIDGRNCDPGRDSDCMAIVVGSR